MRISLDYRLIEVNIDVATESHTTGCNYKDIATQIRNFIINQAYYLWFILALVFNSLALVFNSLNRFIIA